MAAMICDRPFVDIDPHSLQTIIQLQLQDSEELTTNSKGKRREDDMTDNQLAMQMHVEELERYNAYLQDRSMAQSVAMAILQDGDFIATTFREEQQAARDRDFAMRLDDTVALREAERPRKMHKRNHKDPWEDDEMLEKFTAIYMKAPDEPMPDVQSRNYDSDGTVAESSTWAAARKTNSRRPLKNCVICGEEKDFFEVLRVPCNHEYCRECLEQLFTRSMVDQSLFPPRCDNQEIPLEWARLFISSDLAKEFEAKYDELNTKNRTYCHEPTCSTFIPEGMIRERLATCPRCKKTTCTECHNPSHVGDCPNDEALRLLVATAETQQWQRCYQCTAMVELEQGCNHMRCRCGADFCYICGERWKTCGCAQWDEPRLLQRAAQLVDRNPNRRLFQPARVAHTQPMTRPPTPKPRPPPSPPGKVIPGPSSAGLPYGSVYQIANPGSSNNLDLSDHSEWEPDDWWLHDDSETSLETPGPHEEHEPPCIEPVTRSIESTEAAIEAESERNNRIARAIEHLRTNHACAHVQWRYRKGRHQCEECRHVLKEFIFECRQCSLQACNRCRRNRL